jgi:hypothetical protein
METRLNKITVICGQRGTGKSTIQEKILMADSKKFLIVDTNEKHKVWNHIPLIPIENLKYWKSGNYRVCLRSKKADLEKICKYINNCSVIFEDSKKYIRNGIPEAVEDALIDTKQKNVDAYFMFHMLSEIPKYLRQSYDNLILFKTKDVADVYRRFSNYGELEKVHQKVMKHHSPHYCEAIIE